MEQTKPGWDGASQLIKRTSQAGAVVHAYRYDAWGNIETGASEPGFAFAGREWDPESGLYYYRARYYDPRIGRFSSEDPLHFQAEINFDAFVRNRPTGLVDPLGLKDRLPWATCPAGTVASFKARTAFLCCKGGQWAICGDAGAQMSARVRECMQRHETYHREQIKCDRCNLPDCTAPNTNTPQQECEAQFLSYMCFVGTGEKHPDGTDAAKEAARNMATCMRYGWPSWPAGGEPKRQW